MFRHVVSVNCGVTDRVFVDTQCPRARDKVISKVITAQAENENEMQKNKRELKAPGLGHPVQG